MAWILELLTRTSPWVGVLLVLLFLVTGLHLGLRAARLRVERRTAGHRRLGRRGTARALKLLRRHGFRVLEMEVTGRGVLRIDGEEHAYAVRCDALVSRGGRQYVAEMKGGADAARIGNRATRRQLLEYAVVFDVDGILLVDADRGGIHDVEFPL